MGRKSGWWKQKKSTGNRHKFLCPGALPRTNESFQASSPGGEGRREGWGGLRQGPGPERDCRGGGPVSQGFLTSNNLEKAGSFIRGLITRLHIEGPGIVLSLRKGDRNSWRLSGGRRATGGSPQVVRPTRISAPVFLRLGPPALLEVDLVRAAFVLGLGEEAQRAVPPDAQPQAPGLLFKRKKKITA